MPVYIFLCMCRMEFCAVLDYNQMLVFNKSEKGFREDQICAVQWEWKEEGISGDRVFFAL